MQHLVEGNFLCLTLMVYDVNGVLQWCRWRLQWREMSVNKVNFEKLERKCTLLLFRQRM